jgi:N-acetylglucosaminyldiphosphoundecaprenol N-acetyl-beta-D-mannosaminyltransferase
VPKVAVLGVDVAAMTEGAVIAWAFDRLERRTGSWICPVNLDVLRQISEDIEIRRLVASADLVVADGMPLVWASHLTRTPLPERVVGSSLVRTLTVAAAKTGRSVYLLGGNDGAAEKASARLCRENPRLRLVGWHCPPFGFERSVGESQAIVQGLLTAKPDIVLVGLGFPKQDKLISELRPLFPAACFVSCGSSIGVMAGELSRAPTILQKVGLEWAYRLGQEPRRLTRRYLLHDMPFAVRLFAHSAYRRLTLST